MKIKKELIIIIIIIIIILVISFFIFKSQNADLSLSGLIGDPGGSSLEIRVGIPEEYLIVKPGKTMLATIEIFNLRLPERVDLLIEYEIRDLKGKAISLGSETVGIETKVGFIKIFHLPSDIKDGTYLFYVKITYDGDTTSVSTSFEVSREPIGFSPDESRINPRDIITVVIILILIFLIIFLRHLHKEHKKLLKEEEKIKNIKS